MNYSNNNQNPANGQQPSSSGQENWMEHPNLQAMDKSKLEMLQNLANQVNQKNQQDLLPFLMAAASKGKSNGLNFSNDEISTIIEVLKMGKSPQEAARLDKIVSLIKMMNL